LKPVDFVIDRTRVQFSEYFRPTATVADAKRFCLSKCSKGVFLQLYTVTPDVTLNDEDELVSGLAGLVHIVELRKLKIQLGPEGPVEWMFPLQLSVGEAISRLGLSETNEYQFICDGREVFRDRRAHIADIDVRNRLIALRRPVSLTLVLPPNGLTYQFDTMSTSTIAELVRAVEGVMEDTDGVIPGFYGASTDDEPPLLPLANLIIECGDATDIFILRFDTNLENTLRLPRV
jgi:hypothetical protein